MKFAREKSLLLGVLALLAPLPLPLNQVVGAASVVAYLVAVTLFLVRVARRRHHVLPYWAMNVLGLLYVPIFLLDLTVLRQGRVLQPLVHLAMFTLAVKLFGMRREKDKWHVFLTIFFLFVASAGTSVHPSVFLYLVAFLCLAVLVMIRFTGLHSLAEHRRLETRPSRVPVRGLVTGTVLAVLIAATPIFFFLPRLRRPYVWAPAVVAGSSVQVGGFSDRLDLDVIGRVRTSRAVLLRFTYDTPLPFTSEQRFKAAVFDRFDSGVWRRTRRPGLALNRAQDGFFHLGDERSVAWMSIWQRTFGDARMVLPVEARAVDLTGNVLAIDEAGSVSFMFTPPATAEYRVGLGSSRSLVPAPPPGLFLGDVPELDRAGITPEIESLAAEVLGDGTPRQKAERAERYLLSNFTYSLDLGGRPSDRPVERFLFETRSGHCEYFVSALVLMLRSQGIPARVVTGYLGADFNEWQGYFIVRQSHAHAWVEAFLDWDGWTVLDPTPPSGRPAAERAGLGELIGQAWDSLLFRWDRYVLTYGFYDQVDAFIKLRDLLGGLWGSFGVGDSSRETAELERGSTQRSEERRESSGPSPPSPFYALPFAAVALAMALWFWWRRERFTAAMAFRWLRSQLAATEGEVPASMPPLEVERRLVERYPQARHETRRVVERYLEESFGGRKLEEAELEDLRELLRQARGKLRKTA